MDWIEYLGRQNIENWIIKQFANAAENLLFSRDDAVGYVEQAFDYIEKHDLIDSLLQLDKRTICQIIYRIAMRPAEEYLWQVQIDMALAGKVDTPDGAIYYYTKKAEDIGERKATYLLSVELSKRRGISPHW
ncbi:hypothetical protein [Candidatus Chlorohelix sp.]|uniref:hypothetical protein n=1 Tax=Candidatus Chlorohelix sp. TaxID=3139201 RepID=UPI0030744A2E